MYYWKACAARPFINGALGQGHGYITLRGIANSDPFTIKHDTTTNGTTQSGRISNSSSSSSSSSSSFSEETSMTPIIILIILIIMINS